MDTNEKSLELHKKFTGKLEIKSKVPIENYEDLSLAYTPGVGEVSKVVSQNPDLADIYTNRHNTVAVVTDGSAVLGLGNLGPLGALPVMEGKCALFKRFANIDAFPICLDTQDSEEIIKAVKWIAPVFGGINLEDISAPRCFEIEKRLKQELSMPVMHDDQHGTATVVLAALNNAFKLSGKSTEAKIVVNGAGAAGTAIAELLVLANYKNVVVLDSKGAISKNRNDLNSAKLELANITNPENLSGNLESIISGADVFIGVSKGGALNPAWIKTMADKPIIFALANPTPEIFPDEAKSAGAFIVASGRSDFPNQINNVLTFPGIFRGALDNKVTEITNEMLIKAAGALAESTKDLSPEKILPLVFDNNYCQAIAEQIK